MTYCGLDQCCAYSLGVFCLWCFNGGDLRSSASTLLHFRPSRKRCQLCLVSYILSLSLSLFSSLLFSSLLSSPLLFSSLLFYSILFSLQSSQSCPVNASTWACVCVCVCVCVLVHRWKRAKASRTTISGTTCCCTTSSPGWPAGAQSATVNVRYGLSPLAVLLLFGDKCHVVRSTLLVCFGDKCLDRCLFPATGVLW